MHLSELNVSERDKFITLVDTSREKFNMPSLATEDAAKAAQAASRTLSPTTDSSSANQYIIGGNTLKNFKGTQWERKPLYL